MYKSFGAWGAFQRCLLVGMGSSVNGPPQGWLSETDTNWLNRLDYENMELLSELFVLSFFAYSLVFEFEVVSCLSLAAFWTHPLSKNRMTLASLNLLILVLTIYFFRSRLPKAGAQLPYVGKLP